MEHNKNQKHENLDSLVQEWTFHIFPPIFPTTVYSSSDIIYHNEAEGGSLGKEKVVHKINAISATWTPHFVSQPPTPFPGITNVRGEIIPYYTISSLGRIIQPLKLMPSGWELK